MALIPISGGKTDSRYLQEKDLAAQAFDCLVNGEQGFENGFEVVQMEGVGSIGFGLGRVVVYFEEDSVDPGGYGGAGEDGDELGLATGDSVGG